MIRKTENMIIQKCSVCGEETLRQYEINGRSLSFSRACACRRKELEAEEEQKKKMELLNRALDIKSLGYLDEAYARYTFDKCDNPDSPITRQLLQYCEHFDKARENNRGIYLFGAARRGKTHYASCMANYVRQQGIYVLIGTSSELIRHFTNFKTSELAEEQIRKYPLMVIDDLGTEEATEKNLRIINEIIDMRYQARKPLIITSNFALEDLYKGTGVYGDRITKRLREICKTILIDGKDRSIQ